MGKKKDWVEEIGNIELEIRYISGVYDLSFLMGYGWYEEVEKIVEQIKQESREEGRREVIETIGELNKFNKKYVKKKELSKLNN